MCDPPRIYPSLPEYTSLFNKNMRRSQNLPLLPRIYPIFQQMHMCYPPRNYPSLPDYTPFSTTVCDHPRNYPSLPDCTPLFNNCMRPFQNLPLPPRYIPPPLIIQFICATLPEYTPLFEQLYATLPESIPPSQNIPHFPTIIIRPSIPQYFSAPGASGRFSHNYM